MNIKASPLIKEYFASIEREVKKSYDLAKLARSKKLDPEEDVSIPLAKNMAERVVGMISAVAPQILGTQVIKRISELEKEYEALDWRVGFKIAVEVAREDFFKCKDKKEAIEIGIRVGFAYLTLGIVSAPLEGFIGINIKKRTDGKEYFAIKYAGPIRGAGGTAASTSVILADYVRTQMGYFSYDPNEKEIKRHTTETLDYHERVTNLQYKPSEEELNFMISNLPIEVDGDPTEKFEVSNYKDLPRIETNRIRGGVALVIAEGLCQKAPKLWKRLGKWGEDLGLGHWSFLQEFLKLKEKIHSSHEQKDKDKEKQKVKANNTFIMDMVAGRPILTHPLAKGGFRLRYGRNRTSGFSSTAVHPATLAVLQNYIAIGTQLKTERPGKATTITVCDTLEGPIVRLKEGSLIKLRSEKEVNLNLNNIEEVFFLGDILFSYGDFSENGHTLVPAGYCPEWWALELKKNMQKSTLISIKKERLNVLINFPLENIPTFDEAINISKEMKVPLHPEYILYWSLVSVDKIKRIILWLKEGSIKKDLHKIVLPYHKESHFLAKKYFEEIGLTHLVINKENVVLNEQETKTLCFSLGIKDKRSLEDLNLPEMKNSLRFINSLSSYIIRDKAGTFIGARMGRPEKAKMRSLTGSPQVMFPVGEEGDRLRSFQAALEIGKVRSSFPLRNCLKCKNQTIYLFCEKCGDKCSQEFFCRFCGLVDKDTCRHGPTQNYNNRNIDIKYYFNQAKELIGEKIHPDLIKGIRGTSNKEHVVEHLAKGVLRAKHNIYVNKDGTTRYDCTELPLTHFKPKEIHTSLDKLKKIGYHKDIKGQSLINENQILELKPQDIILPGFDSLEESGPQVLFRVAKFIDELLVKFYKLKPFYNLKTKEDLVGHLVIGLAPHISAGLVGRIIGYSKTQGLITHPLFHAGLRRDCDGDEAAVMLLMDALLNFSRKYLPNSRGSTMDAPLVLTAFLDPGEVDDQVHGLDVEWNYPLDLYEAALELKKPWEIKIEQIKDRLGTEKQYENMGFTHKVDNFNKGVLCSAYKTAPTMKDKLTGQMEIARKVRAVDMDDVARLVIQGHFLKDIKGNLRKFSMQKFRCVKCNEKYRRPPLNGKCSSCKGKLLFTITEGSVVKYLSHSLFLAEKYDFSPYLKETLNIIKSNVDGVFGKEKEKQVGLNSFIKKKQ